MTRLSGGGREGEGLDINIHGFTFIPSRPLLNRNQEPQIERPNDG